MKLTETDDVAVLFNSRARGVTTGVVRALGNALPHAQIRVCEDLAQQERQLQTLMEKPPRVLLCGGGDGTATQVLNTLRKLGSPLPALGLLRLGTGNAWARTLGAPPISGLVPMLKQATFPLLIRSHHLVEIEGVACPFAGVGWDAALLNDYQRQRDRASSRLFTSPLSRWLHNGLPGYLYSAARFSIPRVWQQSLVHSPLKGTLTSEGAVLYQGPVNVAGFSTIAEYGFGLRAFPLAPTAPEKVNVRVLHASLTSALRQMPNIWKGRESIPGMADFFVTQAEWSFSRPVALQIAGDPAGTRERVELRLSPCVVQMVDWHAVSAASTHA